MPSFHHESVAYALTLKGITVSLEGGIKGYLRSMSSDGNKVAFLEDPDELTNVVNTNYLTLYATPRFEYWVKRVNITLNAPLALLIIPSTKLPPTARGLFLPLA